MRDNKEQYKKIFGLNPKLSLSQQEKQELLKAIHSSHNKSKIKSLVIYASSIAACLILLGIYFYPKNMPTLLNQDIAAIAISNESLLGESSAIQRLSLDLAANSHEITAIDSTNTATLLLNASLADSNRPTPSYSTIFIPYGKRQEFILPDKSTVWLNAGSYLTFKDNMQEGSREVYLNGEGYFDIVHTGTDFIVHTAQTAIKVLGTSFNVNAYASENISSVELLTGSIALQSKTNIFKELIMSPGERILYDTKANKIHINRSANGDDVLWTKKQLVLRELEIDDLIRKLERVYNVKIHADKNLSLMDVRYSGRLNIDVDIVSSLKSLYELSNYEITQREKEVWIRKK